MIHINDISVSSKHAEIEMSDDFKKAYLIDKGALNGCYINEKLMDANTKKRLQHNDVLTFGNSQVKYKFVSTKQEQNERDASDSDGEKPDLRRKLDFDVGGPMPPFYPPQPVDPRMDERLKQSED